MIKCATIIVTCVIIIIFFVCKKDTNLSRKLFCFKIQAFSKYMLWASAYLWYWAFYELFNLNEVTGLSIISFILTMIFFSIFLLFSYCFIVYPNKSWCLWSRFAQINKIRHEFLLFSNLNPNDYFLIIRYNFARKLILSSILALQLRVKISPFILIFVIIATQWMYSNLIAGLQQFKLLITKLLMIFNIIMTTGIFLLASIEYLNESFNSSIEFNKLEVFMLFLIRIHILSIIWVELLRILWAISKNVILKIIRKLQKKPWI